MMSPLGRATKYRHIDAMQLLLEHGAIVDSLIAATADDYLEGVKLLLQYGVSATCVQESMRIAAKHYNIDMLELLTNNGTLSCHGVDTFQSLISKAIEARDDRIVIRLFDLGFKCSIYDHDDIVYICSLGIDVNRPRSILGYTMLHIAIADHNISTVRLLLSKGADIHIEDNKGITPIMMANDIRKYAYIVDDVAMYKIRDMLITCY